MIWRRTVAALVGLGLLLGACGGDDDANLLDAAGEPTTSTRARTEPSDDELDESRRAQLASLYPLPVGPVSPSGFFQPTFGITFTEGWLGFPPADHTVCFVRDPEDGFPELCMLRHPDDAEPQAVVDDLVARSGVTVVEPGAPTEVDGRPAVVVTVEATAFVDHVREWALIDGYRYRYTVVDVDGRTVMMIVEAPIERFDAFLAEAQPVADSVDWDAPVVP